MAGGKGTTYKNNYLTWALTTGAAPTRPTSWTVALYTDAAGSSNPPTTEATGVNCPGYSRQTVTFAAPSNGSTSNTNDVQFTSSNGAWATINYFAVLDNTGAIVEWSSMANPRTLQVTGDKIDFAIGAIVVNEA